MKKSAKKPLPILPGKSRKAPQKKNLQSFTKLLGLGTGLRQEVQKQVKGDKSSKDSKLNQKESVEIQKMKKLWNKVDRILRSRSASTYSPMPRVFGASKKCVFLSLLRDHNCNYVELVKSIQLQSPWIPECVLDSSCHSIQKAALAIGWADLLGDENLLIQKAAHAHGKSVPKVWKMMKFNGAMKKLEPFRTHLTKRLPSSDKKILLPMLQRAATRTYSNFLFVTADGGSPYEELTADELNSMNGYSKSFFKEIGKPCLALTLFDIWFGSKHMSDLIDEVPQGGKFPLSAQRSLKKAAGDRLQIEKEKFQKCPFYNHLANWVFPSTF